MSINFYELIGDDDLDGARAKFERLVIAVAHVRHQAMGVAARPGDWGIDAFFGELDGKIAIWLLERMRAGNDGGDVHLVGGPQTIKTFRALGALDKLGLLLLPIVVGEGLLLGDALSPEIDLTLNSEKALPEGAVELEYSVSRP